MTAPAPSSHHLRETCRSCGGRDLECVLELGSQPLANSFPASVAEFEDEKRYPLDLYVCGTCFLVQLLDVVDPEVLFRDYVYLSGTSRTMLDHFSAYARHVMDMQPLRPEDLVVEAASNDGSLLRHFRDAGVRVLGIEPARNVAELSRAQGLETVVEFLNPGTAEAVRAEYGEAKVVLANNVFAHVDDSGGFLDGCRRLLAPEGLLVVEAPYLVDMLHNLEYDTIYHEHLCYFSATALLPLFEKADLSIVQIDHHSVHGGSLRVHARRRDVVPQHGRQALDMVEREARDGLMRLDTYRSFGAAVSRCRDELVALLAAQRAAGRRIAGYGAPAKGNTLLNYCRIGPDTLDYIVDRNELKTNRFTPGSHIPVEDVTRLESDPPDAILVLAWNYADEIMDQLAWLRERGAAFIVPVPHPRVV